MAVTHIWDTNIAIYYLEESLPDRAIKIIVQCLNTGETAISVITELELLGYSGITEEEDSKIISFRDSIEVIELSQKVKEVTIKIRRRHRIKLPDAIIAATAIAYDLTLLSRNEKDFAKIEGLNFVNPFLTKTPG